MNKNDMIAIATVFNANDAFAMTFQHTDVGYDDFSTVCVDNRCLMFE